MAAEDARLKAGLKTAEDELNLIKNQVQQTLLDIREHILDATNPFSAIDDALTDEDEIEFGDDLLGGAAGAAGAAGADGEDGEGGEGEEGEGEEGDELVDGEEGEEGEGEDADYLDDEDPGDEIIEEGDDGYMGDEYVDDGMGAGGMGDAEEIFEEEEIVPDEDEGFEVDEEPIEDEVELDEDGNPILPEDELGSPAGEDAEGSDAAGAATALVADFDVLTMAGLVRWVAVTTEKLGYNRTEILLDAFEAAGRIAPSTRAVLHHLMALSEEDPEDVVPVREIVSAMVRMEGVLEAESGTNSTRLLSMLMDVDDDPLDRLLA